MQTYAGIDFDAYRDQLHATPDTATIQAEGQTLAEIRRDGADHTVTFPDLAAFDAPGGRFGEAEDAFTYAAAVVDAATTAHAEDPAYLDDIRSLAALWTAEELATAYSALIDARTSHGTTLPALDVIDAAHAERTGTALSAR